MQYKVVPGPTAIEGKPTDATAQFESIINKYAVDGWKYHSMETITAVEKTGCMKSNQITRHIYMLIFVREV